MSEIRIFSDGACSGNPGPGGWAAIICFSDDTVQELGGADDQTTNNRMEIRGTLEALLHLAKRNITGAVTIYTDSQYLIQGSQSWLAKWRENGWQTQANQSVSNKDLWQALEPVLEQFKIRWVYVPGHANYPGNERCDKIAVAYSLKKNELLYSGSLANYPVDLSRVPSGAPIKKFPKPVYLSLLNGKLERHTDWKSCEARVKGQKSVKYKKVESQEEEEQTLMSWGLKNT